MEKLTFKEKVGYGSASIGDAAVYTFICSFLLFFLTTVVGIEPATAGTITVIASVWNAVINPIIGYMSDHSGSRWGRRRFFMLGFTIPMFFVTILLFTSIDTSYGVKVFYYGIMTLAYWTCYTGFFIPYYALGAEYTDDYNERTVIRSYASFFNLIGVCFSMIAPASLVKFFVDSGLTESKAWTVTALIIASISLVSIMITVKSSKNKDIPISHDKKQEKKSVPILTMFREYLEVLSMKAVRIALFTCLFYLTAYTMFMSDLMYFLTYNMGYVGMQTSAALLFRSLVGAALLPVIIYCCKVTDKRITLIAALFIGAVGVSIMRGVGTESLVTLGLLLIVMSVGTAVYWQVMPAIIYDLCEYDEYMNGKRREGAIVSIQGLVESVAAGIGSQILGIILQIAGFDGDAVVQGEVAQTWIFNCLTLVPAVLLIAAAITLIKYPISRAVFESIKQKLNERKKD